MDVLKKCERVPTHLNKCTFIQRYFAKKNAEYVTTMGLSIIGTGKRFFPSSKLPQCSPSLLLIDYPEVQRPGHEPEVRNEWSGASTPLIHLHVGPRDSAFARMGQYVSPGVHVGRYKLGVTRIYMYKGRTLRRVCFMKY